MPERDRSGHHWRCPWTGRSDVSRCAGRFPPRSHAVTSSAPSTKMKHLSLGNSSHHRVEEAHGELGELARPTRTHRPRGRGRASGLSSRSIGRVEGHAAGGERAADGAPHVDAPFVATLPPLGEFGGETSGKRSDGLTHPPQLFRRCAEKVDLLDCIELGGQARCRCRSRSPGEPRWFTSFCSLSLNRAMRCSSARTSISASNSSSASGVLDPGPCLLQEPTQIELFQDPMHVVLDRCRTFGVDMSELGDRGLGESVGERCHRRGARHPVRTSRKSKSSSPERPPSSERMTVGPIDRAWHRPSERPPKRDPDP